MLRAAVAFASIVSMILSALAVYGCRPCRAEREQEPRPTAGGDAYARYRRGEITRQEWADTDPTLQSITPRERRRGGCR